MLPRAHRLHLSADLRRVMRRGRRFVFTQGVVFVGRNNDELTRFGVIVPKKVGNAVVRHRVARMVRHSWMPVLLKHPHGLEIVVRADAGADSLSVADWTSQVEAAVAKQ